MKNCSTKSKKRWKTLNPANQKDKSCNNGSGSQPTNFMKYPSAGQETEKHLLK